MDNPFAFPVSTIDGFTNEGMTLRDWFAGKALAGDLGSQNEATGEWGNDAADQHILRRAEFYYRFADAMLLARAKPSAAPEMQHVAYFDEGEFHWMSGIKPRDCELYAARAKGPSND